MKSDKKRENKSKMYHDYKVLIIIILHIGLFSIGCILQIIYSSAKASINLTNIVDLSKLSSVDDISNLFLAEINT
jgi:hypothetical protein